MAYIRNGGYLRYIISIIHQTHTHRNVTEEHCHGSWRKGPKGGDGGVQGDETFLVFDVSGSREEMWGAASEERVLGNLSQKMTSRVLVGVGREGG